MDLHYTTILTVSAAIAVVQGGFLMLLWGLDRRSWALRWWALCFLCLSVGMLLLSGHLPLDRTLAIQFGNPLLILSSALAWQATRSFDGRPVRPVLLLLPAALWLVLGLETGFLLNSSASATATLVLSAVYFVMAALETWRGRSENLPSRVPMTVVLGAMSVSYLMRLGWADPALTGMAMLSGAEGSWLSWVVLATMIAMSAAAALAMSLAKERMQLTEYTYTYLDPTTGALNLSSFLTHAARLMNGQMRERKPVALLLMHLGDGSARGGHQRVIGDEELRVFYDQVVTRMRPADLLARVGAQNFALVTPGAGPVEARAIGERFVRMAQQWGATHDRALPLTVTVGAVCSAQVGYDLRSMILAADAAVEEAKERGTGQVSVYKDPFDGRGEPTQAGGRFRPEPKSAPLTMQIADSPQAVDLRRR